MTRRDTDIVRAMKLAVKHLSVHQRKYTANANLWKMHEVAGCEGEANRYDEIQFAIDEFNRAIVRGLSTQITMNMQGDTDDEHKSKAGD